MTQKKAKERAKKSWKRGTEFVP